MLRTSRRVSPTSARARPQTSLPYALLCDAPPLAMGRARDSEATRSVSRSSQWPRLYSAVSASITVYQCICALATRARMLRHRFFVGATHESNASRAAKGHTTPHEGNRADRKQKAFWRQCSLDHALQRRTAPLGWPCTAGRGSGRGEG